MTPAVSVVIVTFNAEDVVAQAIDSVARELGATPWEGVVVDNASSDRTVAAVREADPRVRVIRNEVNIGFARGVNQGVAATTAPVVLTINPDCRLSAGAFRALEAELLRDDRTAIVAPEILNADGSPQGNARGDPDMLTGIFGRTGALRRLMPGLAVSRRNVVASGSAAVTVDWVSGACMLARRAALDAVGGFDERYFLYWEDADLCRRLRRAGYVIRHVPSARAVHEGGHSARSARPSSIRAFHESAYLYYATHVAPSSPMRRVMARVLLNARSTIRSRMG